MIKRVGRGVRGGGASSSIASGLLTVLYFASFFAQHHASTFPPTCGCGPSHPCGAEKLRDVQWPSRQLRFVDEHEFAGGHLHKS